MRTARQGTLDGLYGVYALINAVDLVVHFERGSALPKELFTQLTHGLGASSILSSTTEGLNVFELERATALAFRWLSLAPGGRVIAYNRDFRNLDCASVMSATKPTIPTHTISTNTP